MSLDRNKNVYEGNDYLPETYEQWIQENNRDNFVVLSGDEGSGVPVKIINEKRSFFPPEKKSLDFSAFQATN